MRTSNVAGLIAGSLAILALSQSAPGGTVRPPAGFAVMGDSDADEYRADDNRGGEYAPTTFNWVELLVRYRNVNFGVWGSRSEPRRSGYEFNWARSTARARDVISGGQAMGLAKQVASGDVGVVLLMIGANDFIGWNGTYEEVYSGALSGAALTAKVDRIAADIAQAMDVVQSAGPVQMYVATITERGNPAEFPDATKRQRVTSAIAAVNSLIVSAAAARNARVVDLMAMTQTLVPRSDGLGNLIVGGEPIKTLARANEPHHLQLEDRHAGTVASGLLANYLAGHFNRSGAGIALFTDAEILKNAGIRRTGIPAAIR